MFAKKASKKLLCLMAQSPVQLRLIALTFAMITASTVASVSGSQVYSPIHVTFNLSTNLLFCGCRHEEASLRVFDLFLW